MRQEIASWFSPFSHSCAVFATEFQRFHSCSLHLLHLGLLRPSCSRTLRAHHNTLPALHHHSPLAGNLRSGIRLPATPRGYREQTANAPRSATSAYIPALPRPEVRTSQKGNRFNLHPLCHVRLTSPITHVAHTTGTALAPPGLGSRKHSAHPIHPRQGPNCISSWHPPTAAQWQPRHLGQRPSQPPSCWPTSTVPPVSRL